MAIEVWLRQATQSLEKAGIGTARLDALVLLEDVTGIDRARLLAEPDMELSSAQTMKLEKLLRRRASHEPLAYVRGHTEFYGRSFIITPAVLEPRPESETMLDLLKVLAKDKLLQSNDRHKLRIADVGTGSGALGITAALELPEAAIDLIDIDPKTLEVAKSNVDKFTLNIGVVQSDLLSKSGLPYDILLCNLPYVPDKHTVNEAATFEPKIAIFGGADGLDLYRKLFKQIDRLKKRPLYILTESLPPQHEALRKIAGKAGYSQAQVDGFIQIFTTA